MASAEVAGPVLQQERPDPPVAEASGLAERLVGAWGSWGPTLSSDARRMAFVSDRRGTPEVWVAAMTDLATGQEPYPVAVGADPAVAVSWSADDAWLAVALATDGGVRTEVWVVHPDGTDARRIAGGPGDGPGAGHAELGPWTRSGHRVAVTLPASAPGQQTRAYLADPATGELHPLAVGDLLTVLDLSVDEHLVVVKDGERGRQFCAVVDRIADADHPLLPHPALGSTDRAILRPAPPEDPAPFIAYLVTDAGLPRRALVAAPLGFDGYRGPAGVLAARDDAELEALDADDSGRLLLLVWNVAGRSEVELLDTVSGVRRPVPGLPGEVASGPLLSRDGTSVVLGVEGPHHPRELWRLDTGTLSWALATAAAPMPAATLVEPELRRFVGRDGLDLTGWLYRVPGADGPGPAVLSLHGGPEAQERPGFHPEHQALVAAGLAVFAPNIRGSSGFGRSFVHADDVYGRRDAFDDVLAAAEHLVGSGVAQPGRIAVTGRSYGGYLTLASLTFSPGVFAAGVDVCGMSDLLTFYRDTEPWIAAAAVTKYGHPVRHRSLLRGLSPLRYAANITAPLLVVHGEHDTNVPIGEARQIVAALHALGRPVDYLELAGEGHEYRRLESRTRLVNRMVDFLTTHLAGPGRPGWPEVDQ